ncbi:MAG: hypothetical protein ACYCXG_06715 [Acidiferrobacter sp.]
MKRREAALLCLTMLAGPAVAAPLGAGVDLGTMGLGLTLAMPVMRGHLNARLVVNGGSVPWHVNSGGLSYHTDARWRNAGVLADYFPFRGAFHVTVGAFYNDNRVNLTAIPLNGTYTFEGLQAPAGAVGPVTGIVSFGRFAPYAGIGWGNLAGIPHGFVLTADIGVIWQRPHTTLSAPGAAYNPDLATAVQSARDQIEIAAERFRLYPVIGLTFGYRF